MKANRKFVQADDAVSPVIAVILMVAITVVLAATVFVLVSDIGGNTGSAQPAISWAPSESDDRLSVTQAAQNADWNRLAISVTSCVAGEAGAVEMGAGATPWHNENSDNTGTALHTAATAAGACPANALAAVEITGSADKMEAGDYLDFCFDGATTLTATNVKVQIKDTTANAVAFEHTFTDIQACP